MAILYRLPQTRASRRERTATQGKKDRTSRRIFVYLKANICVPQGKYLCTSRQGLVHLKANSMCTSRQIFCVPQGKKLCTSRQGLCTSGQGIVYFKARNGVLEGKEWCTLRQMRCP